MPAAQKADILRMLLLLISVFILVPLTDASKIYHSIRGQDTIKLYVIFNALEVGGAIANVQSCFTISIAPSQIADRLLTSIGQDILDCLFSRSTLLLLSNHVAPSAQTIKPLLFFVLSLVYTGEYAYVSLTLRLPLIKPSVIVSHALVLVYQLTALNVAINAYDNALLTLLLSNQFVEIKGSVFKKFEKDNLFQITCAGRPHHSLLMCGRSEIRAIDIVERFQLALMLFSIAIRNLIELSSADMDLAFDSAFVLPVAYKAFRFISGGNIIGPILTVSLTFLFPCAMS